jgi:hypothetical protein
MTRQQIENRLDLLKLAVIAAYSERDIQVSEGDEVLARHWDLKAAEFDLRRVRLANQLAD